MRATRRASLSTFVALASGLVVLLVHAAVSAQPAITAAWARPLEEGRRAHARGDFASAARLFAEGDRALGGWPYEESPAFDDEGHWVHADERDPTQTDRRTCAPRRPAERPSQPRSRTARQ
ncbi:MAG: hypothetical protein J0L92_14035 [Deltaproteobacteria bacterium]|nr:hypothetical protein [Deltaproteobacteria bacterium]